MSRASNFVMFTCLLVAVTKFQNKFASLPQLNCPNTQNKFQICCTNMCFSLFLGNFVVFSVFLSIFQDFVDIPGIRGSTTVQNIGSPEYNSNVFKTIKTKAKIHLLDVLMSLTIPMTLYSWYFNTIQC